MISEQKYIDSASILKIDIATIKAVAQVESGGAGFLPSGEPVILFEPHIFWKQLVKRGISPEQFLSVHPDYKPILYKKWGEYPYGKSSEQHKRLQRAATIDRIAALESASWGKFQIMGYHWSSLGYTSLQEFINAAYKDEDSQLDIFVRFIQAFRLESFLRVHDWAGFALRYNGKGFKKNRYDEKLEAAYHIYIKF